MAAELGLNDAITQIDLDKIHRLGKAVSLTANMITGDQVDPEKLDVVRRAATDLERIQEDLDGLF